MKIIYFLLIPLMYSYSLCAQNINVTYEQLSFGGDFKNIDELHISKEKSRYISVQKGRTIKLDSNNDTEMTMPSRHRIIEFDFRENKVHEFALYRKKVFKAEWEANYNWIVTEEIGEYLGYEVTKAYFEDSKGARTYAWFTTQIPVSTGPLRYNGLPGLILLVTHDKINSSIRAISINKNSDYIFENNDFEETILISKEDIIKHNDAVFDKEIKKLK